MAMTEFNPKSNIGSWCAAAVVAVTYSAAVCASTFAQLATSPGAPERPEPRAVVRMLVSDGGGDTMRAYRLIETHMDRFSSQERRELIELLGEVVASPEHHMRRPSAVRSAMAALGRAGTSAAVKPLITHIGFPIVQHPDAGDYTITTHDARPGAPLEQTLPAIPALVRIGEASIDEVVQKLAETEHFIEEAACIIVLRQLAADPVVLQQIARAEKRSVHERLEQVIRDASEDTRPRQRARLEEALAEVIEATRTQD